MVACGTYLVLTPNILRVVLGTVLITHGALMLFLTMAGLQRGMPPILNDEAAYADPLPQALILTAIVIAFGVTAYLVVLAYRAYQDLETDDLDKLRGVDDEQ